MKELKYIANIHRLQRLIADEFASARQQLTTTASLNQANIASIIAALQGQDTINQRIQHLIDSFECSRALFHDKRFKHSFLDLQYFQLVAIGRDLEKAIATIRTLANTSISKLSEPGQIPTLFPRYTDILHLLEILNRTSIQCVAQRILSGPTPLNSSQADDCLKLYTMQSERIVLQWFLSSMPFGKRNDLLRVYEAKTNVANESIEIF
jgi:hypothetical protein